jgi:hypothetical protein
VWIGQSTNENIRAVWDSVANPYDRGCLLNYLDVCCMVLPTSRLPCMSDSMEEDEFLTVLGPAFFAKREKERARARGRSERREREESPPPSSSKSAGGLAARAARALSPTGMASALGRLGSLASPRSPPSGTEAAAAAQGPNSPLIPGGGSPRR